MSCTSRVQWALVDARQNCQRSYAGMQSPVNFPHAVPSNCGFAHKLALTCSTDSMTMVVVRLSSAALRKKVSIPTPHNNRTLRWAGGTPSALMIAESGLKPPCCRGLMRRSAHVCEGPTS